MRGISNQTKEILDRIVEGMFDRIAVNLLGFVPKLKNKTSLVFTARPIWTLSRLFIEALGSRRPLPKEEEVMKNLISTAHDYLESLKNKTKANLSESVDSYVKEARAKGIAPSETEIKKRITETLAGAGKNLKVISEAETTKARNMGKLMNIAQVGASIGQPDPTVFFVVVRDKVTCDECKRIHVMPDGVTPRVWKVSELGYSYHKKGEQNPKIAGLHPHCRCTMTLLAPGYGFKNGKSSFISLEHDEFKKQRE